MQSLSKYCNFKSIYDESGLLSVLRWLMELAK